MRWKAAAHRKSIKLFFLSKDSGRLKMNGTQTSVRFIYRTNLASLGKNTPHWLSMEDTNKGTLKTVVS